MRILSFSKTLVRAHPKLLIAIAAGAVCFLMMPGNMSLLFRGMVSWNVIAWIYIVLLWLLILSSEPHHIKQVAQSEDETAATVLFLVCIACVTSLGVIFLELANAKDADGVDKVVRLGLSGATLLSSWLLIPTAFTIHYAHIFYQKTNSKSRALNFPDKLDNPGYWDFLYFSFTISVASQTADVSIGNTSMRKIVLLQSVLSFIFNISILGIFVNVAASLS
ncbi:DUF1345 domain-containing protein [Microvirga sp. W0021]|uniref:DUF1345 domain-containing protein n=1 Tax=Hohaiivirga grylli TaxID=3133970 RepID=A0ABV0BIP1_9HYPH